MSTWLTLEKVICIFLARFVVTHFVFAMFFFINELAFKSIFKVDKRNVYKSFMPKEGHFIMELLRKRV
jgi:hypothetical protein